jgi:hypothetical protein
MKTCESKLVGHCQVPPTEARSGGDCASPGDSQTAFAKVHATKSERRSNFAGTRSRRDCVGMIGGMCACACELTRSAEALILASSSCTATPDRWPLLGRYDALLVLTALLM